ncbi:MAG TPA: hypothetical protein PLC28_15875 [Spirochaetota bacterium]|nr:hypothetical protein [Spirochaetota bacterium]HQJ72128.1 hypothetical protein [Spirochaetota bacterium]
MKAGVPALFANNPEINEKIILLLFDKDGTQLKVVTDAARRVRARFPGMIPVSGGQSKRGRKDTGGR